MSKKGRGLKASCKMVKFGDVVKNANLVERDPIGKGIERIVGLEHIDPENLHIRRWNNPESRTSFTRKFVPGQTLFGKRRAYQRKVAFAEFEGICSGDILTFEPKNPIDLLPELLPFICQTDAFFNYALGTSAGSLSPRTSWKALKDFEFPLLPLKDQKLFAEIFWAADEAEKSYRNIIDKLSQNARSIERETFGHYLEKGKKGVLPFVELYKLLKEPITNGIFKKREQFGKGTLLINVTDIYSSFRVNPLGLERVETIDKENVTFSATAGDIIFNRSSLVLQGIGKACLVPEWDESMVFECHLMRVRPDEKKIHPRFLCRYSLSSFGRRYLFSRAQTTTMTTINQGDLGKMPIPLPTIGKQIELADKLDLLDNQISEAISHQNQIWNLKRRLINQTLIGNVDHV